MPATRPSEARLEASDVGALVRGVHPCGSGFVGAGQVAVSKGRQALQGLQLRGMGVMCRVEECAEWVGCCFPLAEGAVEPAASDSKVGCYLLWCRVRPRFRRQGCCLGGRDLWVWEVEVTVVKVWGEKDVAGRHVQAAPAVAQGRALRGQGCAARGHGYGPHVVRCVRHVVIPQLVPGGVGDWPKEAGVAGGGGSGCGRGPCAVVRLRSPQ